MAWPQRFRAVGPLFPLCSLHHLTVCLLTFAGYIVYHASRKTFSNVKMLFASDWTLFDRHCISTNGTRLFLSNEEAMLIWGTLDTIFLFSYAVGLYVTAIIGEEISLRLVMAIGMCSSALMTYCFGTLTKLPYFYNKWFYFILSVFNGLLESTGWPCVVAIMDSWFGMTGQGFVFGIWSACASVGNLLGGYMASVVLHYGYENTFLVTASLQLASGLIIIFTLWLLPEELAPIYSEDYRNGFEEDTDILLIDSEDDEMGQLNEIQLYDFYEVGGEEDYVLPQPTFFSMVTSIPLVFFFTVAHASKKLVNYSFFFWLPYYLNSSFGWGEVQVSQISIWYDIEKILIGRFWDLLSDVVLKRSVLAACLLLAFESFLGHRHNPQHKTINALLMTIAGIFISTPFNIMGSGIPSHLGFPEQMQGSREAFAPRPSLVNRTISMGKAVTKYVSSLMENKVEWLGLSYFSVLISAGTILFISILLLREVRDFVQRRQTDTFTE